MLERGCVGRKRVAARRSVLVNCFFEQNRFFISGGCFLGRKDSEARIIMKKVRVSTASCTIRYPIV